MVRVAITPGVFGVLTLGVTACSSEVVVTTPSCNDTPGLICTIAGTGESGYDARADDEALPALQAKLSIPLGMLSAPDGSLYILDFNNHRIRRLDPDGMIHWVIGNDLSADPPAGTLRFPTDLIFDETGDHLLVANWLASEIVRVSVDSTEVSTIAGDGARDYFGDGGEAPAASFDLPVSLVRDDNGELLVLDQKNQVVRRIDDTGTVTTVVGRCLLEAPPPSGGGPCEPGEEPDTCPPDALGRASGKLHCGDSASVCDRGAVCTPGYAGDGGPAAELRMAQPTGGPAYPGGGMVIDVDGALIFADTTNHVIRRIDSTGIVRRIAGRAPVDGMTQHGYAGDGGPAVDARLHFPRDLALGADGTLYLTDSYNDCVRAVDAAGIIRTVAGRCGERGYAGDGGPADQALLDRPLGIEYRDGRLFIADTVNHVIRMVRLQDAD